MREDWIEPNAMMGSRASSRRSIVLTPRKSEEAEFDAFSDTYNQTLNDAVAFSGLDGEFVAKVKADYLLDLIAEHYKDSKNCSVLDIGCGVGNHHSLLTDGVGSITGVDISKASLATAAERNPSVRYDAYDGE